MTEWDDKFDQMSDEELQSPLLEESIGLCIWCQGNGRVLEPDSTIYTICMGCLGAGTNWRENGQNH